MLARVFLTASLSRPGESGWLCRRPVGVIDAARKKGAPTYALAPAGISIVRQWSGVWTAIWAAVLLRLTEHLATVRKRVNE